jgi:putative transcriptional regulator
MLKNTVKEWRQAKQISKAHLARQIGVCRSYVSKLEQGNLQPSGEIMFRIAEYFDVRIEGIFKHVRKERSRLRFFGTKSLPNGNNRSKEVAAR